MPEPPVTTTGEIVEALANDGYRARLPNGKIIFAYLGKALHGSTFTPGDLVALELTPFDFSKARIAGKSGKDGATP